VRGARTIRHILPRTFHGVACDIFFDVVLVGDVNLDGDGDVDLGDEL
jgi:hypothetical protein